MDLKERYNAKLEEIRSLEQKIAELGEDAPSRYKCRLMGARVEAEELRLWGQRETTRALLEARKQAQERGMRERVRAEWERIEDAPLLSLDEIRRQREELGARQQDVAAFAGIHRDTVSRVERGNACDPLTLKLLSVALEEMRASRT